MARALGRTKATRNYAPVVASASLLLLLLAILPSALNLPQANPTQTVEFAPVADQADTPPAPVGNFASLGLAGSATVGGSRAGGAGGDPPEPTGSPQVAGRSPTTKRCVGRPPRQTEDPVSPPCVANFSGDNFGSTYTGVTGEEVRLLVYITGGGSYSDVGSRGVLRRPTGEYFDLATPPADDDPYYVEASRIWQRHFNERYQTYGRFVHVYVYFSSDDTVEDRRADAIDNFNKVKPFAVIFAGSVSGFAAEYAEIMAQRGVLNFGADEERPASLFQGRPKLIWGYGPSIELHARQFSSYVCKKVLPFPVSFGDPVELGKPRKLGLLSTTDEEQPAMRTFASLVRKQIEGCGGTFAQSATFPSAGYICCPQDPSYAQQNMAAFRAAGITTIVWAEGFETLQTKAAASIGYVPEWVVAGDTKLEDIVPGKYQDQTEWAHAWVVTNMTLDGKRADQQCYQAAREVNPSIALGDSSIPCKLYPFFRQVFVGIQVAGPRLGPSSVDAGFHAIPGQPSSTPTTPACFYEKDDYTCVKDAIPMWWDATAQSSYNGAAGCYRAPEAGKRYLTAQWPDGDVIAQRKPDDPCNAYTSGGYLDPSPGADSPPPQ